MEKYYELDPKEVVISEEKQKQIREADYINGKRVIAYIQNKEYKNYNSNEVIIPEEKQQEIREVDYIGKKRVIVYHQNETFKVCNKDNRYYVGNYGKIYSTINNKCLSTWFDKQEYERVKIGGKLYQVHRLILELFAPCENSNKLQVNHINFNRSFNVYDPPDKVNLEWCTAKENTNYSVIHGRRQGKQPSGENTYNHKYTNLEVYKICKLLNFNNNISGRQIAEQIGKKYDKSFNNLITDIRRRKNWKFIANQFPNIQPNYKRRTEEDIYKICKLLSSNNNISNKEIAEQVGREYNNAFRILLSGIRNKRIWNSISSQFSEIHSNYNQNYNTKKQKIYKICELLSSNNNISGKQIAEQVGIEYNNAFTTLLSDIRSKKYWNSISSQFPNIKLKRNKTK